jgi:hypothetical protein
MYDNEFYFKRIKFPGPYPPAYLAWEKILPEFAKVGQEISVAQAKRIGAVVETNVNVASTLVAGAKAKGDIEGIRGGIRVPHLHYGDTVRVLKAEEWSAFSLKAAAVFAEKLAKAKNVSFDQLNEIAEATSTVL